MSESWHTWEEVSRTTWQSNFDTVRPPLANLESMVRLGCLQRIARSLESIARSLDPVQREQLKEERIREKERKVRRDWYAMVEGPFIRDLRRVIVSVLMPLTQDKSEKNTVHNLIKRVADFVFPESGKGTAETAAAFLDGFDPLTFDWQKVKLTTNQRSRLGAILARRKSEP